MQSLFLSRSYTYKGLQKTPSNNCVWAISTKCLSLKCEVAWWRNGRASDLWSRGREFDFRPGRVRLRNDSGQVVHIQLPRRWHSSLVYRVVKLGTFTLFCEISLIRSLSTCTLILKCQCFTGCCAAILALVSASVLWRCWSGGRKDIRPVKIWVVGCWHGYLSGARCRLACGPADATATHCLLLQ